MFRAVIPMRQRLYPLFIERVCFCKERAEKGADTMRAYVDENCIGCGLCASVCPEVFELNDDQVAEVTGTISEETEESVKEARDGCPVDAIHTEE